MFAGVVYTMDTLIILDATFKILISLILGGVIGLEREIKRHPAGFRTYILVCLGSTLLIFISYYPWETQVSGVGLVMDTSRIAAAVVTGIGFLGAGAIFKEGVSVKGLTTAAGLWVTAGVGLLVGVGLIEIAIISTVAILITLSVFSQFEDRLSLPHTKVVLHVKMADPSDTKSMLESLLHKYGIEFEMAGFLQEADAVKFTYTVAMPRNFRTESLIGEILSDGRIYELRWE